MCRPERRPRDDRVATLAPDMLDGLSTSPAKITTKPSLIDGSINIGSGSITEGIVPIGRKGLKDTIGFLRVRSSVLAILALAGFAVVLSSSIGFDVGWISPKTPFGLFGIVPLGYWLGISIILFSMVLGIRNHNEHLFFLQALLMFVSIWGAPSLFETYPSIWDSYTHFQTVDNMIRTGVADLNVDSYGFNYPGFFVLTGHYVLLGDHPILSYLRFYPIFASAMTLLSLYLFARCYVPGLNYRFALIICILANVWIQVHFSPQSLGFVVGILFFVFLEKDGLEWLFAAMAAFVFVVVSHPTTVIFLIGALVVREVALRGYRLLKRKAPLKTERPWPISIFFLIWIAWLFTNAVAYSTLLLDILFQRLGYLSTLPSAAVGTVSMRTAENIFLLPPLIRTGVVGAFVLLALVSILTVMMQKWLRRSKRRRPDSGIPQERRMMIRIPANVLALFILPFIVVPLDIIVFGGQFYDRGLLFLVLGSSIIITLVMIGTFKGALRAVIVVLVVVLAGAAMTTTFYQESLYAVSGESVNASDFLDSHMQNNSVVIGGMYPDYVWGDSAPTSFSKFGYITAFPDSYSNVSERTSSITALVFDRSSELWNRQYGTIRFYNFYLDETPALDRVYDSGAYTIYSGGATNR